MEYSEGEQDREREKERL